VICFLEFCYVTNHNTFKAFQPLKVPFNFLLDFYENFSHLLAIKRMASHLALQLACEYNQWKYKSQAV